MTNEELDKYATAKALDLLKGCGPYHNIMPTKELVIQAYGLGYDVVKRPSAETGNAMQARYPGSYQMWASPAADGAIGIPDSGCGRSRADAAGDSAGGVPALRMHAPRWQAARLHRAQAGRGGQRQAVYADRLLSRAVLVLPTGFVGSGISSVGWRSEPTTVMHLANRL